MSHALATIDDVRPDLPEHEEQLVLDDKTFSMFAPLKAIERRGGSVSLVSLDPGPDELSYATYEGLGKYLGLMERASRWWVADWLIYGEHRFDGAFSQAVEATGLAEQTLLNRMSIARSIPPDLRRPGLAFSVHAEVAGCKTTREKRYWLDKAEKHGWNRDQLRAAMKAKRTETAPPIDLEGGKPDEKLVVEAANALVDSRKDYGADWLVSRETMARLIAALGRDEEG